MANKSDTWRGLLERVADMTEDELKSALNYEIVTTNRSSIVLRLHQRYTKVRMFRERDTIKNGGLL